jgi:hypothetical protein
MRQLVESDGRPAVLAAFVALLVVGIYDRWTRGRPPGHGEVVVLNAGAVALDGGTVTVFGGAAGTHGGP